MESMTLGTGFAEEEAVVGGNWNMMGMLPKWK